MKATLTNTTAVAGLVLVLLLAGCGGGDSATGLTARDSAPLPPGDSAGGAAPPSCTLPPEGVMTALPPGIFGGTIDGDADSTFVLVTRDVWDDGGVGGYLFYGLDMNGPPKVDGIVWFGPYFGCSANDLRARNGRNYAGGTQDPNQPAVYVHVTLDPAVPSLTGSIRTLDAPQQTRQLAGGALPGSTFDAKAMPDPQDIAGAWTLVDPLGTASAFTVSNDGKLEGSYRGCALDGTVQPSVDGNNLFVVRLRARPCEALLYLENFVGFALAIPLAKGGVQLLLWAEANDGVDGSYVLATGRH